MSYVKTQLFMFFYLISILIFSILCRSDIEIKDAGIVPVSEGDIAMIFYLTIGSKCDKDLEISVHMEECCEQSKENQNDCKMLLIGGHMGILYKKYTKNVTLIYPNLYLLYRQGTCTVAVKYRSEKYEKVLTKVIEFKTNATTEEETGSNDNIPDDEKDDDSNGQYHYWANNQNSHDYDDDFDD